jgi:hypothetical protein
MRVALGGEWRERWPQAVAVLAPLILFLPFLVGAQSLYWGTPLLQFYPWREFGFDLLRAGRLPLWNPYVGNGAPLLANYQSALLYPPNWLGLLLPVDLASGWLAALHLAWAGVGTSILARRLGVRPLGQAVSGLAFGVSQYLVARVGFFSINATAAWLPWLVLAAEGVLRASHRVDGAGARRAALGLSAAAGLALLAGHAQMAWYSLTFTGAWCGWRLLRTRQSWRQRATAGGWLLAGVLLGAGLAAAQLAPTWELMQQSPRAEAADYDFVMNYSFSPWRLLTLIAPDLFGNPAHAAYYGFGNYWEDAVYVGVLPLLLALGAAGAAVGGWWARRRGRQADMDGGDRALVFFLCAVVLATVALALGQNTPIFPFFYHHVPTFNLFQAPARLNLLSVFALALLAGLGADRWGPPAGRTLYWTRLGAMGAATLLAGGLAGMALARPDNSVGHQVWTLARGLALGGGWLLAALLLSLAQPLAPGRWRPALAAAFVAADLIAAGWGLNPGTDPANVRQPSTTAATLRAAVGEHRLMYYPDAEQVVKFERMLSFQRFGPPSLAAATRAAQLPNTALLDGLASANNFEPLVSARYSTFMGVVSDTHSTSLLRLMDVSVVASHAAVSGWERVAEAPEAGVGFYRVPGEARRWWVVGEARLLPDAAAVERALREAGFDPAREVLLEADDAGRTAARPLLTPSPDAVTMPVVLAEPGWVLLAETYYPGWYAWVDGRPVPLLRANLAFRAVAVPAGSHTVVFDYQPASVRLGGWLTAAAMGVWVLGAAWRPRRRPRQPGPSLPAK